MTAPASPGVEVLGIGEAMILVTPAEAQPLTEARDFRLDVGGAESNVATHLARAGIRAAWAGAVGADPLGERVLATLRRRGVDVTLAAVDDTAPTGLYLKDPGPDGTRVHYYRRCSAASRLGPDFALGLPLGEVPLVHLTGITSALSPSCAALVEAVIGRRRAVGLPVSFDVNHRPALWGSDAAERLLSLARRCDLVFVGLDEGQALWDVATAADLAALIGSESRTIVVKDGARAATWFRSEAVVEVAPERADVHEAVGAGDAFAAGFIAGLLRGGSPERCLTEGNTMARTVLGTTADFAEVIA
ncbi:sugar kinase [Agromyces bauzanensis]|uniref:Carbohydrate kinase n=1 Tax=Agromyces bauzanensis TaxID=1308924 RepID=A0A917USR7_9MICO|nr:sugar kinase [Agromyces bauzanensis]GGJ83206.1 carbohydrate kinase [Agromyces bauzanensis]